MKIIHIADTHLGLAAFNRLDPESGMNLREKLMYENFLSAIDRIVLEKPDVLIHAGDLFDTVKPKTRAYTTVLEALERLHAAGVPFVVIAGNHSMVKTRYTTSPFEVLAYHPSRITTAHSFVAKSVEIGDTVFHLVPNMLNVEDYRKAFDKLDISNSHHNVMVTHGLATTIQDKRLQTVGEHEIDTTMLSDAFDYIALGHYHSQCQVADNAWYSGSMEYITYGEIRDRKGGLFIDLDKGSVRPLALPHTPMIDLGTMDCRGIAPDALPGEVTMKIEAGDLPAHAMVRIVLDSDECGCARSFDQKALLPVRERLLDLKIHWAGVVGDTPVPVQQDLRAIDYISEFETFVKGKNLAQKDEDQVKTLGRETLLRVMAAHQEA
ncbi:MAG: metallophosphoesterase [Methanomicrobiales archaeon]